MDAATLSERFATAIDQHEWSALDALLHEDFLCTLVHTGERMDRTSWITFNRHYPGFERSQMRDLVADGDRAVLRADVTGTSDGRPASFAVASFLTVADNRVRELTEVWTDVCEQPPAGTRPEPAP